MHSPPRRSEPDNFAFVYPYRVLVDLAASHDADNPDNVDDAHTADVTAGLPVASVVKTFPPLSHFKSAIAQMERTGCVWSLDEDHALIEQVPPQHHASHTILHMPHTTYAPRSHTTHML